MAVAAEKLTDQAGSQPDSFEALFAVWQTFDIPEGFRAEIAEGAIRMNPPPAFPHNVTATTVLIALMQSVPDDLVVVQTQGVEIASEHKLYVPDLIAVSRSAVPGPGLSVPSGEVVLAVEITSRSNARIDRDEKLVAYARGAVPTYLLIDRARKNPTVTLYSDPVDGEYQRTVTVPFGDPIHLPAPFDVDLDTSDFPR